MIRPAASVRSEPELVTVRLGHEAVGVARMSEREQARDILARSLIPGWPAGGRVTHDGLGRPLAALPGFHLSFSRLHSPDGSVLTYAAACGDGGGVLGLGIDAAHPAEFGAAYPLERVFTASELGLLRTRLVVAREQDVQALAWACKEAAVKALGCAFHHCEPRDVVGLECLAQGDTLSVRMRAACRHRSAAADCLAWKEGGAWIVVGVVRSKDPRPCIADPRE
jgi:phosphopantetheinyl transferase (holo-ACP synthase)